MQKGYKMNEKRYRVEIPDANHLIILRNRQVRTPVEFENVTEAEMSLLKSQTKRLDIKCFIRNEKDVIDDSYTITEGEEIPIIEELLINMDDDDKSLSILNQLLETK